MLGLQLSKGSLGKGGQCFVCLCLKGVLNQVCGLGFMVIPEACGGGSLCSLEVAHDYISIQPVKRLTGCVLFGRASAPQSSVGLPLMPGS